MFKIKSTKFGHNGMRLLKNLLKLGKIAPFLGTALDFAFPEPLADGTLENAQRMNIPGTPVVRSNKAMDASSFNITEAVSYTHLRAHET